MGDGFSVLFIQDILVLPEYQRKGIGTKLLQTAEDEMRTQGIAVSLVHMGSPREQWFESYAFYPKHGYREYKPRYMRKEL